MALHCLETAAEENTSVVVDEVSSLSSRSLQAVAVKAAGKTAHLQELEPHRLTYDDEGEVPRGTGRAR